MLKRLKQGTARLLTDVVAHTPLKRVFLRSGPNRVVIFTLHRRDDPAHSVRGHDPRALERTLQQIRRLGVPVVGLMDVLYADRGEVSLPPVSVCFTLDDGYWDQADVTVPLLLAYDVPPSLFVLTGFLDGKLWPWDARAEEYFRLAPSSTVELRLGDGRVTLDLRSLTSRVESRRCFIALCKAVEDQRREDLLLALASAVGLPEDLPVPDHHRPMSWDRARQLERQGVRFGSHSISHRLFSRVTDAKAAEELVESRRRVQTELRDPLPIVAWPIGRRPDFGLRDLTLAEEAGYSAAVDLYSEDHVLGRDGNGAGFRLLHRHGFVDRTSDALRLIFGVSRLFDGRPGLALEPPSERLEVARIGRLVFVCKGNICRSPYAEARARLHGFDTISCGVSAAPGALADPSAFRNASLRGVDLRDHRSRRLDELNVGANDLLISMDDGQHRIVAALAGRVGAQWTRAATWLRIHGGTKTIADPYGHDDLAFQRAFEMLDDVVGSLAESISVAVDHRAKGRE